MLLCFSEGRLVAKVADFGTARFAPALLEENTAGVRQTHHSTRNVIGTTPYMPAEYIQLGHVSEKTDTFAFGVVLCELLTGLPPSDHAAGEMLAAKMAKPLADVERLLPPLLDARLGSGARAWPLERALALGRVAQSCVEPLAEERCFVADVLPQLDALAGRQAVVRAKRGEEYDPMTGKLVKKA